MSPSSLLLSSSSSSSSGPRASRSSLYQRQQKLEQQEPKRQQRHRRGGPCQSKKWTTSSTSTLLQLQLQHVNVLLVLCVMILAMPAILILINNQQQNFDFYFHNDRRLQQQPEQLPQSHERTTVRMGGSRHSPDKRVNDKDMDNHHGVQNRSGHGLPFNIEDISEVLCGGRKCLLVMSPSSSSGNDDDVGNYFHTGYLIALYHARFINTQLYYLNKKRKKIKKMMRRREEKKEKNEDQKSSTAAVLEEEEEEVEKDNYELRLVHHMFEDGCMDHYDWDFGIEQFNNSTSCRSALNRTMANIIYSRFHRVVEFEETLLSSIESIETIEESTNSSITTSSSSFSSSSRRPPLKRLFTELPTMLEVVDDDDESKDKGNTMSMSTVRKLERFITTNRTQVPQREPNGRGFRDSFDDAGPGGRSSGGKNLTGADFPPAYLLQPVVLHKVRIIPRPRLKIQYQFDWHRVFRESFLRSFLDQIFDPILPAPKAVALEQETKKSTKNKKIQGGKTRSEVLVGTNDNTTLQSNRESATSTSPSRRAAATTKTTTVGRSGVTVERFVENLVRGMDAFQRTLEIYPCLYVDLQFVVDSRGHVHHIDLDRCFEDGATPSQNYVYDDDKAQRRIKHMNDFLSQMMKMIHDGRYTLQ